MAGDGKILIRMPGSGVVIGYASQRERDQSVRLAQARQEIAHHRTGYIPAWDELGRAEQEDAALEARNWLRAAVLCGLVPEDGGVPAPLPPLKAPAPVVRILGVAGRKEGGDGG
jgi:hypothetical protein